MKLYLALVTTCCVAISLASSGWLDNQRRDVFVRQYEKQLFDKRPSSPQSIGVNQLRDHFRYLRDNYTAGKAAGSGYYRQVVFSLARLGGLSRCSPENEGQFEKAIAEYTQYPNLVAIIKAERESYRKSCIN